ncbi:uncharacterized protein LOC123450231 [Hordeum vulgare subsp. vulgare]|uniref:Uncharacterized protein n=1 Tax=Hordeum vulgare subsp. vulgare TaxID=112509 RepID=A0A8I6WZ58_HORVV|nr:uncharacterized protein LOC123450231 [Hordeum vulgare subsp. vulgare]
MALLRALRRALPPLYLPAAPLSRRAPGPPALPPHPLWLLDPIGFRPFSAVAATTTAVARAPEMGASLFRGLTETRSPKRRPGFVSRRKRASLRPKGPHYWVKCKPGEPIPSSQPNEGSVQGRKEKKRIKQRKDFIMAEKRKRKAQYSVAVKRKEAERTERKMAAVARDRAWVERLAELKQMEAKKRAAMA